MPEIHWIKILTDIFEDEKIRLLQSMPDGDAVTVMWFKLLTQAGKANMGGYVGFNENTPYDIGMLSVIFNKPHTIVKHALDQFSKFGMIEITDRGFIYITNWEKHQAVDKMDKLREQARLRKQNERERKKALPQGMPNVTQSHAIVTPSHATDIELDLELDKEKDIKKKPSSPKSKIYEADSPYFQMAEYFMTAIKENVGDKVAHLIANANMQTWADDFRKIVILDKRDKAELKQVIDFATADEFWSTNVLSAATLRKQYVKLAAKLYSSTSIRKSTRRNTKDDQNKLVLQKAREEALNGQVGNNQFFGSDSSGLPKLHGN